MIKFNAKDIDYKETREALWAYVGRTRRDPLIAMEIGNYEGESCGGDWWSALGEYGCVNDDNNESEINRNQYSVKEKGGGAKSPNKGGGKSGGEAVRTKARGRG